VASLAVARLLAWRLAENRRGELVRGRLTRAIGPVETNLLMGPMPSSAPAVLDAAGPAPAVAKAAPVSLPQPIGSGVARLAAPGMPPGLEWLDLTARAGESNSWVIAGSRTKTGRPLLANDPHLQVELPSIWYEVHIIAAGLDVEGVTLPSAPFVIIGHNGKIAWGITNTGADVVDFYVEDVDMTARKYLFRGQWLPLGSLKVPIGVRGLSRPADFEIFSTAHGPLVATENNWEEPPDLASRSGRLMPRPLALRWEAITQGETAGAFDGISRAASWDEFLRAVRRFGAPSSNFVYADVDGHIGYAMSGSLPIRISASCQGH
jgi:penicillin amidase